MHLPGTPILARRPASILKLVEALPQRATDAVELFRRAAEASRGGVYRRGACVRLPAAGRLLATGDLHDNPTHLEKILRIAGLDRGTAYHLVLHELIHGERLVNGVDLSHRMLLRAAALVAERPDQVHVLLANHELAQLTGRGVSKGGGDSVALFDEGLAFAYGEQWTLVRDAVAQFLRALPLALVSEGGVLCAHSLPASLAGFDAGVLERDLADADYRAPGGAAHRMVWGRGLAESSIESLARRWSVRLFCLGHEHVESGIAVRGSRVVVLNSDHEYATVLPLDLADLPGAEEAPLLAVRLRSL